MTAFNYAMYPALITIFALKYSGTDTSIQWKVAVGFTLTAAKELFSLFVYIITTSLTWSFKKKFKDSLISIKNDFLTKSGLIIIIAGLFGGPIGYSFQTISALYAGGGLAVMLVSSSTILTALGERWLLKNKFSKVKSLGIFLSGLAVILLGIFGASANSWSSFALMGIMFSFFAAVSWTIETLFLEIGMKKMERKIKSENALGIKLFSSTIVIFGFILPVVGAATNLMPPSYNYLSKFFVDWKYLLGIWLVGLFLMLGRKYFIKSIENQGSTMGVVWYTLSSFISPILILIFGAIGLSALTGDIATLKSWWFWSFSILLITGIMLSSADKIIIKWINIKKAKHNK